jgi:hypothetical protein
MGRGQFFDGLRWGWAAGQWFRADVDSIAAACALVDRIRLIGGLPKACR